MKMTNGRTVYLICSSRLIFLYLKNKVNPSTKENNNKEENNKNENFQQQKKSI